MQDSMFINPSFGDCDPAGIVFYPNIFRWMDGGFHHLLRAHGGHSLICEKLGAVGLGLMSATADFLAPIHDGDTLELAIHISKWSTKTISLDYCGRVGQKTAFTGKEVRGLFKTTGNGIVAGNLDALRLILESKDEKRQ